MKTTLVLLLSLITAVTAYGGQTELSFQLWEPAYVEFMHKNYGPHYVRSDLSSYSFLDERVGSERLDFHFENGVFRVRNPRTSFIYDFGRGDCAEHLETMPAQTRTAKRRWVHGLVGANDRLIKRLPARVDHCYLVKTHHRSVEVVGLFQNVLHPRDVKSHEEKKIIILDQIQRLYAYDETEALSRLR